MDKTSAYGLLESLCHAWDGKSASNKVFLMKKLMLLSMKEGSNVSSHLNEFNSLFSQLTSKGLNFDDEMKAIFLLCSLPSSWDTFNTAIDNSTHGGKLAFGDVTSALFIEEIRRKSQDSGGHACEVVPNGKGMDDDAEDFIMISHCKCKPPADDQTSASEVRGNSQECVRGRKGSLRVDTGGPRYLRASDTDEARSPIVMEDYVARGVSGFCFRSREHMGSENCYSVKQRWR
ncbi:hypothetical protein L7F22_062712 [Adiantum nelumboides]|nr:hypothetical protein [Adiantum nelumboides]